jgi:hypothetical protein
MRNRGFLSRFALTFATALLVNVLIVYLLPLLVEGRGTFD